MAIIDFAGMSDKGLLAGGLLMGIITYIDRYDEFVSSEAGILRASERSL